MIRLVLSNQRGGVAKTTTTHTLARYFAGQGLSNNANRKIQLPDGTASAIPLLPKERLELRQWMDEGMNP
jgi:hypothetical protein